MGAKSVANVDHGKKWSFDPQVSVPTIGLASSFTNPGFSSEKGQVIAQDTVESKVAVTGGGVGRIKKTGPGPGGGKELRRARMIITVQRTEEYEKWLIDNPLQEEMVVVENEKRVEFDVDTDESFKSKISEQE